MPLGHHQGPPEVSAYPQTCQLHHLPLHQTVGGPRSLARRCHRHHPEAGGVLARVPPKVCPRSLFLGVARSRLLAVASAPIHLHRRLRCAPKKADAPQFLAHDLPEKAVSCHHHSPDGQMHASFQVFLVVRRASGASWRWSLHHQYCPSQVGFDHQNPGTRCHSVPAHRVLCPPFLAIWGSPLRPLAGTRTRRGKSPGGLC
mmetsp:Transcript_20034/g.36168  ORF Transcript_20034/g.36168 Transcript_20034/m.36168 type:complete len:201 (+) Transcript_20034:159-761(+)